MQEARDASGTLTAQYFDQGQTISGTVYFYTTDHLGSVREMTTSAGAIATQFAYDSYGRATKVQESQTSDFQYAGYYMHAPSGLNMTAYRNYNSELGRWISRDPLDGDGGENLYDYVDNVPTSYVDPSGLSPRLPSPTIPPIGPLPIGPDWPAPMPPTNQGPEPPPGPPPPLPTPHRRRHRRPPRPRPSCKPKTGPGKTGGYQAPKANPGQGSTPGLSGGYQAPYAVPGYSNPYNPNLDPLDPNQLNKLWDLYNRKDQLEWQRSPYGGGSVPY